MKRVVWISLLAILAFAFILLLRFPASWAVRWLPPGLSCNQISGTVWTGSCSGLVAQGVQIDNASWDLQRLPLLTGRLSGHVEMTRGTNFVRGDLEARSSRNLTARNLTLDLPLDRAMFPQLPANLSGRAHANLALLQIENGVVTAVQGDAEGHDIVTVDQGRRLPLGSYRVSFPAADTSKDPVGELRSLSGPLDVQGTLRLTRSPPGFLAEGWVAAHPDASPQLVQSISYLGSPDAQGRRQFSVENTF
jgi:general secretion pathway protein N